MKGFFNIVAAFAVCTTAFLAFSCENDITEIGTDLFDGASANVFYADVVSYNTNNDSIRADEEVLQNGIVGVYEEAVFGRIKARFISQARLGVINPTFGENADVDSVILNIPVFFKNKEQDIEIDTTYVYLGENEEQTDTATIDIKRTYKLDSIYGSTSTPMTLQVREVSTFLYSQDSTHYSNPAISNCQGCDNINNIQTYTEILGTLEVKNKVSTYQRKKMNDPAGQDPAVTLKVKLDKDYFKNKFLNSANSVHLSDQASFIRNLFRGIELSVAESQGFLMGIQSNSSSFSLNIHVSFDNPNEDPGDGSDYEPRKNSILPLIFQSYWSSTPGYNVQVNQFEHSNRSSAFVNAYTNPNTTEGDSRLYLAGLDGTKTVIKIDQEQLDEIRNHVENDGWAIIGAELNFHVDNSYDLKKPPFLFAWNNFIKDDKVKDINFEDVSSFYNRYPNFSQFNPMYNYKDDDNKYTIRITDYIKGIVEKGEVYEDAKIILSLGNFLLMPTSQYTEILNPRHPFYNNRAFNPYRIVLHGSNSEQIEKRLKLKIYYTKK